MSAPTQGERSSRSDSESDKLVAETSNVPLTEESITTVTDDDRVSESAWIHIECHPSLLPFDLLKQLFSTMGHVRAVYPFGRQSSDALIEVESCSLEIEAPENRKKISVTLGAATVTFVRIFPIEAQQLLTLSSETHASHTEEKFSDEELSSDTTKKQEVGKSEASSTDGEETLLPSRILVITVTDVVVPLTIDHLRSVFQPYGDVERAVLFSKNNASKALVQLPSIEAAALAIKELNGMNIFESCNRMSLTYSTRSEIQIKYNGPKSYDFTREKDDLVDTNGVNEGAVTADDKNADIPKPGSEVNRHPPSHSANGRNNQRWSEQQMRKGQKFKHSQHQAHQDDYQKANQVTRRGQRPQAWRGQSQDNFRKELPVADVTIAAPGHTTVAYTDEQQHIVPVISMPGSPILLGRSNHSAGSVYSTMMSTAPTAHYQPFSHAYSTYVPPFPQPGTPMLAFAKLPNGYTLTMPGSLQGHPAYSLDQEGSNVANRRPKMRHLNTPHRIIPTPDPAVTSDEPEIECTVFVENLPLNYDCDAVFVLFGSFGDVKRVIIIPDRRDCALVEFTSSHRAKISAEMLNDLHIRQRKIKVTVTIPECYYPLVEMTSAELSSLREKPSTNLKGHQTESTHEEKSEPRTATQNEPQMERIHQKLKKLKTLLPSAPQDVEKESLTKYFLSSPLHRFGNRVARERNVHPPGPILHLSNLHPSATNLEVVQLVLNALNLTTIESNSSEATKLYYDVQDELAEMCSKRLADGSIYGFDAEEREQLYSQLASCAQSLMGSARASAKEIDIYSLPSDQTNPTVDVKSFEHDTRYYTANDIKVVSFQRDPRMAYVWLPSVEASVHVLVKMHNYLWRRNYVRVSFTNKEPGRLEHSNRNFHFLPPQQVYFTHHITHQQPQQHHQPSHHHQDHHPGSFMAQINTMPSHHAYHHPFVSTHGSMAISRVPITLHQPQLASIPAIIHTQQEPVHLDETSHVTFSEMQPNVVISSSSHVNEEENQFTQAKHSPSESE